LGVGTKNPSNRPVQIERLAGITQISCYHTSLAINDQGLLYLWGTGVYGEYLCPQNITSIPNAVISGQLRNGMGGVIDETGLIWVWGDNKKGELGVGDYSSRVHPYPLVNLKGKKVKDMALGNGFAIALGQNLKVNDRK